jgi:putative aldouronate transport system permease protein
MVERFSLKKGFRGRTLFIIFNYIFLTVCMLAMILPLLTVISNSLDTSGTYGLKLIPQQVSMAAYKQIVSTSALYRPFMISVYVTLVGTFMGLAVTTVTAYVLIQHDMPGRKIFVAMIMFTMIFNAGLLPNYMNIKNLGLMNTLWAVILPLSLNTYNMILMKSFFEQLPKSLFEAAEIDGCSPLGMFIKIALPLSKPALASIGLFLAVAFWNEFFHFVMYITDTTKYNFQVKLREMVLSDTLSQTASQTNLDSKTLQNASIVVAMVPFMLIYPFLQKYFVKGITLGAVKG